MRRPSEAEVEAELRRLGERRVEHERLADDIRIAVRHAEGIIPMTRVAELLHLDRTTLYRVYRVAA